MASKVAIISVDGHVKPPRAAYRDYLDPKFGQMFADLLVEAEASPDGFVHPALPPEVQWDAGRRIHDLESQGVVGEVVFPNGKPFQDGRVDFSPDPALVRASNMAYNRWLIDFCSEAPDRFRGLAAVSFDDVGQAVSDIYWAKEHGLSGILMPPLHPGSRYFFDPALDPIWAACQDAGLPLAQHGGTGAPSYEPTSFASFMVLATEHSFFSGRSLWQLILGGVFDRFPALRIAYIETEQWWIGPVMDVLDRREMVGDDWSEFAETLRRVKPYSRLPSEYWASNCYAGLSPFVSAHLSLDRPGSPTPDGHVPFGLSSANSMAGMDYPHPETAFPGMLRQVKQVLEQGLSEADMRKVLYGNAAELFHFDMSLLDPHIERVGFDLQNIPVEPPAQGQVTSLFEVFPSSLGVKARGHVR